MDGESGELGFFFLKGLLCFEDVGVSGRGRVFG